MTRAGTQQLVTQPVAEGSALLAGVNAGDRLQQGGEVPASSAAHIHTLLVST